MDMQGLCLLSTGDSVNLENLAVSMEPLTQGLDRDYGEEDRSSYAQSRADFPCDLDLIQWPDALRLPWRSLIARARANMWNYQQKSMCKPEVDVYLVVESSPQVVLPQGGSMRIKIAMDSEHVVFMDADRNDSSRPYIEFFFSTQILLALMLGASYWNVAEYHMQVYRNPDQFDPTVRSLLAFLKL